MLDIWFSIFIFIEEVIDFFASMNRIFVLKKNLFRSVGSSSFNSNDKGFSKSYSAFHIPI
jgi:hypothetical protein